MDSESNTLSIDDFNYNLPPERIAQFPLQKRDDSKLLFYNIGKDEIAHKRFFELPEILDSNFVLVRNNSKVFPARFFLSKPTGGNVELLIETPLDNKLPENALNSYPPQRWLCIMRGRNLHPDLILQGKFNDKFSIKATILEVQDSKRIVKLEWEPVSNTLSEILEEIGKIPLPEYIKRSPKQEDKDTYQTIFAINKGSIAAPTAGLHFTEQLNEQLINKGVEILEVTLHVGSGTFVPLKTNIIKKHNMHSEQIQINIHFLKHLHNFILNRKKIIATGTTTVRTLESLYWLGCAEQINLENVAIKQWDWNTTTTTCLSPLQSLERIIEQMEKNKLTNFLGETQLMIIPGYEYKLVDGMITNFHLPKSTLLLLVAAFTGRDKMLKIYQEALDNDYRFLSYGDSTLLLK